jgi:hypothetical protein
MGVPWGIVEFPANEDRSSLIQSWQPLGRCADDYGINIMHGTDRLHLAYDSSTDNAAAVTVTPDPDARARLDALSCGDGTYDEFEQLFDGIEAFVPFDTFGKITAPGTPVDGLLSESLSYLITCTRGVKTQLARDLHAAALVAHKYRMMITISF